MSGDRYSRVLERTETMLNQWLMEHPQAPRMRGVAAPFGLTEDPRLRWRVSADVRDDLMVVFDGDLAWRDSAIAGQDLLYSLPLQVDAALPPNSVVLEPLLSR